MTLKTLRTKANISLTLDKDFIQFCELNEIDDIEKLAKETFKRGFDLLKYGNVPSGEITSQNGNKVTLEPTKRVIPDDKEELESKSKIIEATPMKSSNAKEVFTKMNMITQKKDLYGE